MQAMSSARQVNLVFNAVAVAMGIAVVMLNLLPAAPIETQVVLLGVGLFALAVMAL